MKKFLFDTALHMIMNEEAGDAPDAGAGEATPTEGEAPQIEEVPEGEQSQEEAPESPEGEAPPEDEQTPEKREGVWSDNWREDYAGDDTKKLAMLKRLSSPKDVLDKLVEQDKLIRSGGHKAKLDENSTPEQIEKYREENGIPESADGYLDALPEGLVLGEDDKEGLGDFLSNMHEANASPEMVAIGIDAFQKHQEEYAESISALDAEKSTAAAAELKEEWGPEYQANINTLENYLTRFPADIQDALRGARLGDDEGTPLLANPNIIREFVKTQREINPMGTQVSGQGMDQLDSIESQIATYEDKMGTKAWFKDDKAQAHYRKLVDARDRFKVK